MEEQRNYGIEPEPEYSGSEALRGQIPPSAMDMSPGDENAWSALSHLSIFVNLLTGFLPVAAFIIWLVFRGRSARVSFHALQAFWYQVVWMVLLTVGWAVSGALTLVLIGFLLFPLMALLTLVPFIHAAYAAYKVGEGLDYRYLWVADMVGREQKVGM